jgi:PAS domain S-box-containing protein
MEVSWLAIYRASLLIAALLGLFLLYEAIEREGKRGRKPLLVLVVGALLYIGVKLVVSVVRGTPTVFVVTRFNVLGGSLATAGFLALVMEYTGVENPISKRTAALLAIEPIVANVLIWLNLEHFWIPIGSSERTLSGYTWELTGIAITNQLYMGILLIAGIALLIRFRIHSDRVFSKQVGLLLIAGMGPLLANLTYYLGFVSVNPTPIAFVLAGLVIAWAIFWEGLFDLAPIGQDAVIDNLDAGVLTIDSEHRLIELNESASRIFGFEVDDSPVGRHVDDVFEDRPVLREQYWSVTETKSGREFEIEFDGRYYDVEVTALTKTGERLLGRSFLVRDVTERKEYEQRIERQRDGLDLLNQMVRHDIRNDLQLVLAWTEMLESDGHVDEEGQEHVETILNNAEDAVELTETAKELAEVMLQPSSEYTAVDVARVIQGEVDSIQSATDEAIVTIDGSLPATRVQADEMVDSVFRNLLKNAIRHNDKEMPKVSISAQEREGRVQVRIADNGTGIPDAQKDAIFGKGEKGLESEGTGIGLYLVNMLVNRYDGAVWVTDNEPEGAIFVVELPIATEAKRTTRP